MDAATYTHGQRLRVGKIGCYLASRSRLFYRKLLAPYLALLLEDDIAEKIILKRTFDTVDCKLRDATSQDKVESN